MGKLNYPIKKISWGEVEKLTHRIALEINKDDVQIDLIVPILRGGMPVALLLSSFLKVSEMSCIQIRSSIDDNPNTEFVQPVCKGITNKEKIKGSKILIVDDILDSKKTLDFTISQIEKYNPEKIYVAILYNFNKSTFDEVYSGERAKENKWIIFPWEEKKLK